MSSKNILFIMCDQLRADYLSCYGHPTLHTPHIDAIAARGVRFEKAYIQAPVCGASRMSTYTGRYQYSNGTVYNRTPLNIGQWTLGDYLREQGMQTLLVGKTHMAADLENMQRLGIDPDSEKAIRARECGFDPFERDDGLHPNPSSGLAYNQYLRERGYLTDNPWHDNANAGRDTAENILSGWYMQNAAKPANIAEEDSETPYMTTRAIDCIKATGDAPWCIHLSYIKPHWPYIVPAPYHEMYSKADILPVLRHEAELENPHPVHQAFLNRRVSQVFNRDEVRETVIPVYMGLIKQIDDQIGRLVHFLDVSGQLDNTVIVFSSDHGDYLGDHWLGEKDYFHEQSIRVPLIIADPSPQSDSTRGMVEQRLVEYIDIVPTFIDLAGGDAATYEHKLEGYSLAPLLHGKTPDVWRDAVFVETDFNGTDASENIDLPHEQKRATTIRTERYKYTLHEAFPPQLFDLENDPEEFFDLGTDPAYASVRTELHERLFHWFRHRKIRTTQPTSTLLAHGDSERRAGYGILIGYWSEND